jgi:L-fuconolactonase
MNTISRRSLLAGGAAAGAALALGGPAAVRAQTAPLAARWPLEIYDVHIHCSLVYFQPIESLVYEMDRAGVPHGSLTQFFGQYDNEYQFAVQKRFPGRFGNIVHVDGTKPASVQLLKDYAARGACGVRLDPGVRTAGPDPYAVWRGAADAGLSISVFGGTVQSLLTDEFAKIVGMFPQTPMVLEHQAGDYNNFASLDDVKKAFALSRFPNAYIMIGGLGEFSRRANPVTRPLPFVQPIPPVIDLAYDAFGPQRMMWGSDFPASAPREGYTHALEWTMDYLSSKSISDREYIFGKTGRTVFPIKGPGAA